MNVDDLTRAIQRAKRNALYPATDFAHETGCPDTVSAAHIGRTCQEMRVKELETIRFEATPVPPRRVILLRSNNELHKRNVGALARVGGFAYTESGVKS